MTASRFILPAKAPRDAVIAKLIRFAHQLDPDVAWQFTCERYKRTRSNAQNNALFGVAYPPIMEHIGLRGDKDRQDLHEFMCGEYFGWVERDFMGKPKHRARRTTTTDENGKRSVLSTTEFMEFYSFVEQRAAEQGILIPSPDPLWFQKGEAA